jgi:hypothetical protein
VAEFITRVYGIPTPAGSKTILNTPAGPRAVDGIGFTAQINKFGRGLFSVDYPTDNGTKRMLSSHLEPAASSPAGTSPPSRRRSH